MKTKYIATILSVLLILPSFELAGLFKGPTVFTETKKMTFEILDQRMDVTQLKTVTTFTNGTKKIFISLATEDVIPGYPMIRVNLTTFIQPESQRVNTNAPKVYAKPDSQPQQPSTKYGIQSALNPVRPPIVPAPPLDFYWWDNVIFLYQGLNHPKNGDPPFNVKYTQPENYYSYWPNDLWTPWAFLGNNIITQHLNKTEINLVKDGIEDFSEFMTSRLAYAGAGLGLVGSGITVAATLLGVKLTAAGLALGWVPWVGLAIAIIGFIVTVTATYIGERGYDQKEFLEEDVQTDREDGFNYLDIREGNDIVLRWEPYFFKPYTILYHYSERNYYISWGKNRDDFQYLSTEWTEYFEEFPKGPWPDAHLPNGRPTIG